MSPLQHALLFGGICILAAAVIGYACCVSAKRQGVFDADLNQHRTPGMGDPRFADESTPIHDELAAQFVIASAERHARGEWGAS